MDNDQLRLSDVRFAIKNRRRKQLSQPLSRRPALCLRRIRRSHDVGSDCLR